MYTIKHDNLYKDNRFVGNNKVIFGRPLPEELKDYVGELPEQFIPQADAYFKKEEEYAELVRKATLKREAAKKEELRRVLLELAAEKYGKENAERAVEEEARYEAELFAEGLVPIPSDRGLIGYGTVSDLATGGDSVRDGGWDVWNHRAHLEYTMVITKDSFIHEIKNRLKA